LQIKTRIFHQILIFFFCNVVKEQELKFVDNQ